MAHPPQKTIVVGCANSPDSPPTIADYPKCPFCDMRVDSLAHKVKSLALSPPLTGPHNTPEAWKRWEEEVAKLQPGVTSADYLADIYKRHADAFRRGRLLGD